MPDLFIELKDDAGESQRQTPLTEAEALQVLTTADFSGAQLIPWGSNYTFAVVLEPDGERSVLAIYKPRAGEAPLWDFPDGTLYQREVAAYRFSKWAGWDLVPVTVVREGPHGEGSLQLYIEPEPETDNREQFWGGEHLDIERLVLFDQLTNNADRKIGHCLRDCNGKVWGIDHGLTFNCEPKLRTVLWQYVGLPFSPEVRRELESVHSRRSELPDLLGDVLAPGEIAALTRRIEILNERGVHPRLNPRRNVPYGWW
jgi:hypothetical protein